MRGSAWAGHLKRNFDSAVAAAYSHSHVCTTTIPAQHNREWQANTQTK